MPHCSLSEAEISGPEPLAGAGWTSGSCLPRQLCLSLPRHLLAYAGGMDANNTPATNGGQAAPEHGGGYSVEPLKPKRPSRTVKEVEALLAALQVAISTDLNSAKQEILERIGAVETSVELIARELAGRGE